METTGLNKSEVDDLNEIVKNTINSLVDCADKHNIDRDSFIQYFSFLFGTMIEVSTFEHYKKGADDGREKTD